MDSLPVFGPEHTVEELADALAEHNAIPVFIRGPRPQVHLIPDVDPERPVPFLLQHQAE